MIDGNELKNYNILEYRNSIGYVSQDAVIFNDSIYNNITLWGEKSELNIRNFHRTIRLSELDELLEQYPEKEDTILGDNGIILSGGQKQRISIARELFKNTEIIIMDEATSSLDSTTEHLVKTNINLLTGNSTMIIIAHRLSTIQSVENILLMDAGKILISGNYDYLIQNSQLFKEMISLQNMSDGFI
ncbi:MAG: ATP-binding cassette domain-containing protein [Saprospiraceae bacterium]|nr:ATP-binding cassette domain-containing protein [Candidatus Brachybacter algidus]MBL0117414.1 ATP-binding cassette domain-containing protein [Candidatus Brachybacter algidus]